MATTESVNSEGVTPEPQVKLPISYDYAVQVYEAMTNEASLEQLGTAYGDETGLVYDGFTTQLFKDLGLSIPYYTKILKELQRMDCVRQLRRGGSTTTSRWLLVQEPTVELFLNASATAKVGRSSKTEQQSQQIQDLNNRLLVVEEALGIR